MKVLYPHLSLSHLSDVLLTSSVLVSEGIKMLEYDTLAPS